MDKGSYSQAKGVIIDEEAHPLETSHVKPKHVIPAVSVAKLIAPVGLTDLDAWASRGHRSSTTRGYGVRFSPPKNPNVDVPMYQIEHLSAIMISHWRRK